MKIRTRDEKFIEMSCLYLRHLSPAELPAARHPGRLRDELFAILDGEEDSRRRTKARRTDARPRRKKQDPSGSDPPDPYWMADFQ